MRPKHLTIVAVVFAAAVSIAIVVTYWLTSPISFEPARWVHEPEVRYRMLESVVKDSRIQDAQEADLPDLLGEPNQRYVDAVTGDIHLVYWVAHAGIDDLWMDVRVKDGEVKGITTRPD